jgi:hypothetical protein
VSRITRTILVSAWLGIAVSTLSPALSGHRDSDEYLSWSPERTQAIGRQAYKRGRVGGIWDGRLLKTERAYNYKLAATLLSPPVIRASARLAQIHSRLTAEQTQALVAEAERIDGTVVMVEIDPREGSGVIPLDWEAFLQPEGQPGLAVRGVSAPELRNARALAGVLRRNYDYDRFWVVFPRGADAAYSKTDVQSIELVVRIHDKEGRVAWPASVLHGQ